MKPSSPRILRSRADVYRSHVEKQVEPTRPNRGVGRFQHDIVPSGRLRPPHVRPETPRQRALRERTILDRRPWFTRLEPDRQRGRRLLPTPDDPDDAIRDRVAG